MGNDWIWLSRVLSEDSPVYGNGEKPGIQRVKSMQAGDSCNTSRWTFINHVGTHVDAPRHFYPDAPAVTDYPAHFWVFDYPYCVAVVLKEEDKLIGKEHVPWVRIPAKTDLLLIKTGFGSYYGKDYYWEHNPGLVPEIAEILRAKFLNVRAIGMDFLSASSWQHREVGRHAHRTFLDPSNPLLLIEDMDLSQISSETRLKRVLILPLRVLDADGSLCTAIAEIGE